MSVKVAIIAAVDAEPGKIMHGRTLLQKKLYFVAALAKEDFGYGPHLYGPYSSVVSGELGALEAAGFVHESSKPLGGVDDFGDVRRYDYALGESFELFLTRHPDEADRYRRALRRINDRQVSRDARLLSIAAKVHLILSDHGEATIEEIREEAKALDWKLSTPDIKRVQVYLQRFEKAGTPATTP